jgi:hypothetical protein
LPINLSSDQFDHIYETTSEGYQSPDESHHVESSEIDVLSSEDLLKPSMSLRSVGQNLADLGLKLSHMADSNESTNIGVGSPQT